MSEKQLEQIGKTLGKELFTKEEIAESDLRVAIISELIRAKRTRN